VKLHLTFAWNDHDGVPELLSGYDEFAFESCGGVPDQHLREVQRARDAYPDWEIRDIIVEVPFDAIERAFWATEVEGRVVS